MERLLVMLGAVVMFVGVGAGAFGAHGLASYFEQYPDLADTYATAVRYQLIHGLALFVAAWLATRWPGALPNWAGLLFFLGTLIFSGSLYLLVFTRLGWFGAITPIGGVAFLTGWVLLFIAAWRSGA